jgi:hypothetical protein
MQAYLQYVEERQGWTTKQFLADTASQQDAVRSAGYTPGVGSHDCRYLQTLIWGAWVEEGAVRERVARRVPVCADCGAEQPARRPRRPVLLEREAARPAVAPAPAAVAREAAEVLLRRRKLLGRDGGEVPVAGLLGEAARRGLAASLVEEQLDAFLRSGWLRLAWKLGRGAPRLAAVTVLDAEALREFAQPGERGRRLKALAAARAAVAGLSHPKAREIAGILAEDGAAVHPPPLLAALAAVARHVEAGDVLAERVFAARHLGDSKALAPVRRRLEALVGPLTGLGIREGAALTLVGGSGRLALGAAPDAQSVAGSAPARLDLSALAPFVGLSREAVAGLAGIDFPAGGLLVVENLAPFEACCRGEVAAARGSLVVWSAGYPGRAVRRLVEEAARAEVAIRAWADLDLDGIRIARLIASWAGPRFEPYRMAPAEVAAAPVRRPLAPRAAAALRAEVENNPGALLAGTLKALLAAGGWVEQEAFL